MKLKKNAIIQWGSKMRVSAQVGSYITLDCRKMGERLLPCEDWDKADFRFPGVICSPAVNVFVSGRVVRTIQGQNQIRVNVEFVGDGEASDYASGWMMWDTAEQVDVDLEEHILKERFNVYV